MSQVFVLDPENSYVLAVQPNASTQSTETKLINPSEVIKHFKNRGDTDSRVRKLLGGKRSSSQITTDDLKPGDTDIDAYEARRMDVYERETKANIR